MYLALTALIQLNLLTTRNPSFWWRFGKHTAPRPSLILMAPVAAFLLAATFIAVYWPERIEPDAGRGSMDGAGETPLATQYHPPPPPCPPSSDAPRAHDHLMNIVTTICSPVRTDFYLFLLHFGALELPWEAVWHTAGFVILCLQRCGVVHCSTFVGSRLGGHWNHVGVRHRVVADQRLGQDNCAEGAPHCAVIQQIVCHAPVTLAAWQCWFLPAPLCIARATSLERSTKMHHTVHAPGDCLKRSDDLIYIWMT